MIRFSHLVFTSLILICAACTAQTPVHKLSEIQAPSGYENIHVHKLASDSLSSTFLIWVKDFVKPHKHVHHTEVLYVIEGEGLMLLGEEEFKIEKDDNIFIPIGSVHAVKTTSNEPLKVLSIQSPEFKGDDRVFTNYPFPK